MADFATNARVDHDTSQRDFLLKASLINMSCADNLWWLMQFYGDSMNLSATDILDVVFIFGTCTEAHLEELIIYKIKKHSKGGDK